MPTVLILENDPLSRVHYLRALSGLPGTSVLASHSEQEAETLLSAIAPDVVVADARWLQRDWPQWSSVSSVGPSVVAIQDTSSHAAHTPHARVLACFGKPVDAAELRRSVQQQLVRAAPDLWFGLADYIQLACQRKRSLQLVITSSESSGVVTIEQGQVWAASYAGTSGFHALAKALASQDAHVALWPPLVAMPAREIAGDWTLLLTAAAQHAADEEAGVAQLPDARELDFSDVLAPTIMPVSAVIESGQKLRSGRGGFDSVVVDAVSAAIERRYADALELFREAQQLMPENVAVRNRVEWLRGLIGRSRAKESTQP